MKKSLFAFALLLSMTSHAHATEMKRACIDSKNGTYVASEDDSIACANGGCSLKDGTNLSGLYEAGTLSQIDHAISSKDRTESETAKKDMKALDALAIHIRAALSGSKNSNPQSEPKLYYAKDLSIFCTSDIEADEFAELHIRENLSEIK